MVRMRADIIIILLLLTIPIQLLYAIIKKELINYFVNAKIGQLFSADPAKIKSNPI